MVKTGKPLLQRKVLNKEPKVSPKIAGTIYMNALYAPIYSFVYMKLITKGPKTAIPTMHTTLNMIIRTNTFLRISKRGIIIV